MLLKDVEVSLTTLPQFPAMQAQEERTQWSLLPSFQRGTKHQSHCPSIIMLLTFRVWIHAISPPSLPFVFFSHEEGKLRLSCQEKETTIRKY